MDYQRACGVTGRAMPVRPRMNQPWQMGCQTCDARMNDEAMPDKNCDEHLAIVTSPVQCWQKLYTPVEALAAGTLFKDLYLPLMGCPGSAYCHRRMGGLQ